MSRKLIDQMGLPVFNIGGRAEQPVEAVPVVKQANFRLPDDLQRKVDDALNETMLWAVKSFGIPQPPELVCVGLKIQANTITYTLQRKKVEN